MFLFKQGRVAESLEWLLKAGDTTAYERVRRTLESAPARHDANSIAPVRFERNTLDMVLRNGARGEKHQVETMLAGVAVLDYDGDGWPDIFIANGADTVSPQKDRCLFLPACLWAGAGAAAGAVPGRKPRCCS